MSTLEVKAIQAPSGYKLAMPTGHILQTIQTNNTTAINSTSTSYADTGLTVNITPTSTSNKILVLVNGACQTYDNGVDARGWGQIVRDSTALQAIRYGAYVGGSGNTDTNWYGTLAMSCLDSPSSTSQLTYKVQFRLESGGTSTMWQPDSMPSTITVMEVQG